jgi:hypothetical protein
MRNLFLAISLQIAGHTGGSASSGGFFGFLGALSRISNYDEIIGIVLLGALRL